MVYDEETIVGTEVEEAILEEEAVLSDSGATIEEKKDKVKEINQQIKTLLEERDFVEREILDLEDNLEVDE
jgi:hypothetical protein